jgi:hypothetical protein
MVRPPDLHNHTAGAVHWPEDTLKIGYRWLKIGYRWLRRLSRAVARRGPEDGVSGGPLALRGGLPGGRGGHDGASPRAGPPGGVCP